MANITIEKTTPIPSESTDETSHKVDTSAHHQTDSESKVEDTSLTMVRDILFGEQKRQHEQRIIDLELLIEHYDQKNRQDMANDFEVLTTEIRLLNQLLSDENKARLEDNKQHQERLKKMTQQHLSLSENMQKMFTQLSANMTADLASIKRKIAQEQKELRNFVEEEITQLKADKADRQLLANTFGELAKQLQTGK